MMGLQDNPPYLWLALEWPLFFRVAVDMPCGQEYPSIVPQLPHAPHWQQVPSSKIRERGSFLRAVFVREMLPPLSLELDSQTSLSPSCCSYFINKICNRHRLRVGEWVREGAEQGHWWEETGGKGGLRAPPWLPAAQDLALNPEHDRHNPRGSWPWTGWKDSLSGPRAVLNAQALSFLKPTSTQEQGPCKCRHSSPIHSTAPSRRGQVKTASCSPTYRPEDHWPKSAQTLLVGVFLNTFINQC